MKRTFQLSRLRLWTVVWLVAALSDCVHPIAVPLWRANARRLKADSSSDGGRGPVERSRRSDSSNSGSSSSSRNVAACRDPGVPRNGQRSGNSFHVGAELVFSCNRGYILEGAEVLTCRYGELDEVIWDADLPRCVAGKGKLSSKEE